MKALLFFSTAFLLLASCTKYADGPSFSLLTRQARITNEWILEKQTLNNSDLPILGETKLTIEKDGTFSESTVNNELGQLQTTHKHGIWSFSDDQGKINMTESLLNSLVVDYEIRELKNKRLKLRKSINNNIYEWVYISK
ncbi:MAG: hypothetical protein ACKO5W_05095 [Crocinitomicaceae bacterium]